VGGWRIVSPSS